MQVFHSSTAIIEHPDISFSRDYLDFGKGFYVTTLRQQAVNYADRFLKRGKLAFLNEYVWDENSTTQCKIKRFERYDEVWLDFIMSCRNGNDNSLWDIVVGGIANDKVFRTIDLYFTKEITKDEALKRLIDERPNNQICFRNQEVIDKYVTFVKAEELK